MSCGEQRPETKEIREQLTQRQGRGGERDDVSPEEERLREGGDVRHVFVKNRQVVIPTEMGKSKWQDTNTRLASCPRTTEELERDERRMENRRHPEDFVNLWEHRLCLTHGELDRSVLPSEMSQGDSRKTPWAIGEMVKTPTETKGSL